VGVSASALTRLARALLLTEGHLTLSRASRGARDPHQALVWVEATKVEVFRRLCTPLRLEVIPRARVNAVEKMFLQASGTRVFALDSV
jgi:hypothetical protein